MCPPPLNYRAPYATGGIGMHHGSFCSLLMLIRLKLREKLKIYILYYIKN